MKRTALVARLSLFVVAPCVRAQATVDSSLAAYINGIRTVDSHAHPMRPTFPAASPDTEYDALPLDAIPAFPLPLRLRGSGEVRGSLHLYCANGSVNGRRKLYSARMRSKAARSRVGQKRRGSAPHLLVERSALRLPVRCAMARSVAAGRRY